jgi:nucleotide-binding universal stress UspA family protein
MTIRDLLVHLDASPRSEVRLRIASDLAKRFDAHLTAIYTAEMTASSHYIAQMPSMFDSPVPDDLLARTALDAPLREAELAEQRYFEQVKPVGIDASWLVGEGSAAEIVADNACYADLAIVGQWDPRRHAQKDVEKIPAVTLLSAGRPVLVVPYTGDFATVGRRVLIAWKKSREAARAVNDAIPFLQKAEIVTLLTINSSAASNDGNDSVQRVTEHLMRHGVKATVERVTLKDIPDATILLNSASDLASDLIVAGGYSHSRVREAAFGGVTRSLLTEMVAPVLLSH